MFVFVFLLQLIGGEQSGGDLLQHTAPRRVSACEQQADALVERTLPLGGDAGVEQRYDEKNLRRSFPGVDLCIFLRVYLFLSLFVI